MTQTRGRYKALTLRGGSGVGREVQHNFDLVALESVWVCKGLAAPDGLMDEVVELVAQQDIQEATGLRTLDTDTELWKAVNAVENAAVDLRARLLALKDVNEGEVHLIKWLSNYMNALPHPYSSYPDLFLDKMLAELANARDRHYREISPAGHWHNFIKGLRELFERFGVKVETTDGSIFGGTLIEIDRQFPGLAFPPLSDGTVSRRGYVRRAIGAAKK